MRKELGIMVLAVMILLGTGWSQAPDVMIIPPVVDGQMLGVLENTIMGDTTATGERVNPNRIYQLQRGAVYFMNGPINTRGYHLQLVAPDDDPANPVAPPVIAPGLREDGSSTGQLLQAEGDVTLKNLYIIPMTPTGAQKWNMMRINKDSVRVVLDNCNYEMCSGLGLNIRSQWTKVYITNCHYRNMVNQGGLYNGRSLEFSENPVDTLVMINNTYFNGNSFFFQIRLNLVNFARIEHNTIVNTVKWPFQWSWQTNAIFSNNLFYNAHSYGEAASDLPGQDFDGNVFGIINVDTLTIDLLDRFGGTEADRRIKVNNNNWFYSSEVENYWASLDTVEAEPFMNVRTQAMFDDDASYPFLEENNTMNMDPGFLEFVNESSANLVSWMMDRRSGADASLWNWDPDGDNFGVLLWPLPENLSYSTDSPLFTGAEGGFPVGDLNWFPDKKAEWETYITSVKFEKPETLPSAYELEQNYPNPFNPTTTIRYHLHKSGTVELRVFDILGRQVQTLVNAQQIAGTYTAEFSGHDLANGVYICSLLVNGQQVSNIRMLLLK
ncbi:T9SS type A sorting domain-containing protein [candidate division KSB1 bacterium]|nr:T9SS type A sorting domain-containing protein [candidate division KSB1 bacterium]